MKSTSPSRRFGVRHLLIALGLALLVLPGVMQGKQACLNYSTPKTPSGFLYLPFSTCEEITKNAAGTAVIIISCTNEGAVAFKPVGYADASVLMHSPQKISGGVFAVSSIGPAGSPPDYLLIMNGAGSGTFMHVLRQGTGGFIEIADIAPSSLSQQANQILTMSACKAGEFPTYGFEGTNGTELPSSSDFMISYAVLNTNTAVIATEQIPVDVMALNFAPLSPAADIGGVDFQGGAPRVRFLSVSNWSYQLVYKTSLNTTAPWTSFPGATNTIGTGGEITLTDPEGNSATNAGRFYKVLTTP